MFRRIALAISLLVLASPAVMAAGKLSVTKVAEINTDAATLWALVGNFSGLHAWHPAAKSTDMTGDGTKVGDKRVLTLGDGGKINETLEGLDNARRVQSYTITESPLPVENYHSTITVTAAGDKKSMFSWTSTFDPKGETPDADAVNAISGVYDGGIKALTERFP
ncbi:MAG: SRPBCC family protein [Gammaproteobacteria bacterium]|nr:SRPBCC family protein [Gammaproteobacteria bacterium]